MRRRWMIQLVLLIVSFVPDVVSFAVDHLPGNGAPDRTAHVLLAFRVEVKVPSVLLVDGDRVWSSFCEAELRRDGLDVRVARDGYEALEEVESSFPDLVVTEIRLAGIDGLDLMARILDRSPRTPVILHTSHPGYRDNFLTWSADAYLLKSLDLTPFREKVRELLRSRGIEISSSSSDTITADL